MQVFGLCVSQYEGSEEGGGGGNSSVQRACIGCSFPGICLASCYVCLRLRTILQTRHILSLTSLIVHLLETYFPADLVDLGPDIFTTATVDIFQCSLQPSPLLP